MARNKVEYDASVIHEFAGRLYNQAASIVASSTAVGVIIGSAVGLGVVAFTRSQNNIGIITLVSALAGGVIGFMRGRERAFKLRLDAQSALCQVQIEKNTRAAKN